MYKRQVLVHFGAPWCGWCHRLEDWLARDAVAPVLAVDFVDLKIDIDRTVGGQELLLRYRKSERGGIPWFAFLDPAGELLADSNGPDGNLGCPWTPAEIAAFGDVLRKVTRRITEAEVAALLETMGPPKEKQPEPEKAVRDL